MLLLDSEARRSASLYRIGLRSPKTPHQSVLGSSFHFVLDLNINLVLNLIGVGKDPYRSIDCSNWWQMIFNTMIVVSLNSLSFFLPLIPSPKKKEGCIRWRPASNLVTTPNINLDCYSSKLWLRTIMRQQFSGAWVLDQCYPLEGFHSVVPTVCHTHLKLGSLTWSQLRSLYR